MAILTDFPGTVTQQRMGRNPMGVKETKVRLTPEARARIERLVGKNRMAEFIREAVDMHLERRESLATRPARERAE